MASQTESRLRALISPRHSWRDRSRTLRLEVEILDLLGAWHELGVDVQFTTSSGDQMAVLRLGISDVRASYTRLVLVSQSRESEWYQTGREFQPWWRRESGRWVGKETKA